MAAAECIEEGGQVRQVQGTEYMASWTEHGRYRGTSSPVSACVGETNPEYTHNSFTRTIGNLVLSILASPMGRN